MSNIKALDALRRAVKKGKAGAFPSGEAYYDAIDECIAEIEREVSERFVELPVDAEGVPIRVGDTVEFGKNRNRGIVKALNEHMVIAIHVDCDYTNYAKCGLLWGADDCYHVKPRTLEDVLGDVWREALDYAKSDMWRNPDEVFAERADEIRELMGVEQ